MKFVYFFPSFFMLSSISSWAIAQPQAQVLFRPITVIADRFEVIGEKNYSKIDLDNIENSNKTITDFLRLHPHVQFDHAQYTALQQGELKPNEISINGALPYDNKFLLNGISLNNQLNPSNNASANSASELMGNSQAVTVNTDLICELTVLDSNISAAYGEFMGGVIEAKTCKPTTAVADLHGYVSYDYTSDRWSNYHDSNAQGQSLEHSSSADIQPHFRKQGLSASLYGNITEDLGFNLSAAQRWSKIPLTNILDGTSLPTQTRQNQNFSLESFYDFSEHTRLRTGIHFLENEGLYHQANIKASSSLHESDSQAAFVIFNHAFNNLSLEHQLNYQEIHSQRTGAQDTYSWLSSTTKNWNPSASNALEGSFGHFEQAEEKFEYAVKAHVQPFMWGDISHQLRFGLGYGYYDALWQRSADSHWYVSNANLRGQSCLNSYGVYDNACDEGLTHLNQFSGQFARTRTVYEAGKIDVQQHRWHAFIEDHLKLNPLLNTTWGLRVDYDSLTKHYHLAPRSQFTTRPFTQHDFAITTGWNRYYGLNSFQNELQDRKRLLQVTESRIDIHSPWQETTGSRYGRMPIRAHLDSPFTDEIVFGLSSEHKGWKWKMQWVNRHAQKQLRLAKEHTVERPDGLGTYNTYSYDNSGYSKANIYTFSMEHAELWHFANIQHGLQFSADYTDVERSFASYNDPYADPEQLIYFNDQLIKLVDRPADNFNVPFTLRANWHMQWENLPLQINHTLHYRSPTEHILWIETPSTDISSDFDHYISMKTPSRFYWDLKATYSLALNKTTTAIAALSINNVTNKKNIYINESGNYLPEIGRQFIAELKLKF